MKWLMIPLGGMTIVAGLVLFWMPLPIGLPLVGLGTWLLLRFSRRGRRLFVRLSRRYPWLRRARERSAASLSRFQRWQAQQSELPLPRRPRREGRQQGSSGR